MKFLRILTVVIFAIGSTSSFAFIDAQLFVGKRSGTGKSLKLDGSDSKVDGTEIAVAGHLDPIPLVPIAFGLSLSTNTLELEKDSYFKDLKGLNAGLEVMAWVPFLGDFKPYGKLGYIVYGKYIGEGSVTVLNTTTDYKGLYDYNGSYLSIGLGYSPLPLISIFLEYNMTMSAKVKATEFTVDGQKQGTAGSEDFNTTAILVGAGVGI